MTMISTFLVVILASALLLSIGAAGAQNIKQSTDKQGTIFINNSGPPCEEQKGPEQRPILWPENTIPAPDPDEPVAVRRSKQVARKQKQMMFGGKPPIMPKWSSPSVPPAEPVKPPLPPEPEE